MTQTLHPDISLWQTKIWEVLKHNEDNLYLIKFFTEAEICENYMTMWI